MKLAILTKEDSHHRYFVKSMAEHYGNIVVFTEQQAGKKPNFDTYHPFEKEREKYELDRWFGGESLPMDEITSVRRVRSMNDISSIDYLSNEKVDAIIVVGTGVLSKEVIEICPQGIFNLHGGDPEYYRGLDSHLWAIYHRDFSRLVATLHRLDTGLDTGEIVTQSNISIDGMMPLHALRAMNIEVCIKLVIGLIDSLNRHGEVTSRPQYLRGRYYSAMPAVLKSICTFQFDSYVRG